MADGVAFLLATVSGLSRGIVLLCHELCGLSLFLSESWGLPPRLWSIQARPSWCSVLLIFAFCS